MKDDQKFMNSKLKYLYNTLEINLFGVQEDSKKSNYRKLVFHKSVYDDCFEGDVKFKKDSLKVNTNFDLIYNFDDVSFYVFSGDVFKLLDNEHIKKKNLLKNDFVPFLINKSYKKILRNLLYGNMEKENEGGNFLDEKGKNAENTKNKKIKKNVDIMALVLDTEEDYV